MKQYVLIVILIVAFETSCETNPDINLYVEPNPIVYAIFDQADSISKIYLTKSFSGDPLGPYNNAKIFDSLFYKNVEIEVVVYFDPQTDAELIPEKIIKPEKQIRYDKNPGVFSNPYVVYVFNQSLKNCSQITTQIITREVSTFSKGVIMITPPKFTSPTQDNSYISLQPNNGFFVYWQGNCWNEIKIQFEILTKTEKSLLRDTLVYFKKGINVDPENYYDRSFSASFNYNAYLGLLNSVLDTTLSVEYRQVGDITVQVNCGDKNFLDYMDRYNFQVDHVFSTEELSATSLYASKSSGKLKRLRFDPSSVDYMKQDPILTKFKFVYY